MRLYHICLVIGRLTTDSSRAFREMNARDIQVYMRYGRLLHALRDGPVHPMHD